MSDYGFCPSCGSGETASMGHVLDAGRAADAGISETEQLHCLECNEGWFGIRDAPEESEAK